MLTQTAVNLAISDQRHMLELLKAYSLDHSRILQKRNLDLVFGGTHYKIPNRLFVASILAKLS